MLMYYQIEEKKMKRFSIQNYFIFLLVLLLNLKKYIIVFVYQWPLIFPP